MDIVKELDCLSLLYEDMENMQKGEQAELLAAIPPEVQKNLSAIRHKYSVQREQLMLQIGGLEGLITGETLRLGHSVFGSKHKSIFQKAKVSWDSKKLLALAQSVYQIHNCKKVGQPTARIMKV